jgi:hypothetical protein
MVKRELEMFQSNELMLISKLKHTTSLTPIGRRLRGRPRKRWIEDIEDDIQIMGIRGWRNLCKEREEWKRITEKAKTHSGF